MLDLERILSHPDKDEIISRLTSSSTSKDVCIWLKNKYPNNKEHQISYTLLDKFKKEYLNIHGNLMEDINQKLKEQKHEENKAEIKQLIKQNKTYKEKINEAIDKKIDWEEKLIKLLNVTEERFGQLFDITQNNPNNLKPDRSMIEYMKVILQFVTEIRKANGAPDQVIQHNVSIQTVSEQAAILQRAIIQTFEELPIETASILIDKFNSNLNNLRLQYQESFTQNMPTEKNIAKIDRMIDNLNGADNNSSILPKKLKE